MSPSKIGVTVGGGSAAAVLDGIKAAEDAGIGTAWVATGGAGMDALTLFAAAAGRTQRIMLGTSIIPTYPRHPIVAVQQVQVLAQLAPGRIRLGVGPSHQPIIEGTFGIDFKRPLGHLREYLRILKALLQEGSVDLDGRHLTAHARIAAPVDVPVMASALQRGSFELCGAEADGAISWNCPAAYLKEVALPAMEEGARGAGRPVPPLIAHAPVCVHDNVQEVRDAIRANVGVSPLPFYQRMFAASGFPDASGGQWTDAMMDAIFFYGSEDEVAGKLEDLLAMGNVEVVAAPVAAGSDREASLDRSRRLLGKVSQTVRA